MRIRSAPSAAVTLVLLVQMVAAVGARNEQAPQAGPGLISVSIRPNGSGDAIHSIGMLAGGRFIAINVQVRELIRLAHGVHLSQVVGGPAWIDTDRFDIVARIEGGAPPTAATVRALLAERFGLAVRWEMQRLPAYLLVTAQPGGALGPQMRRSTVDCRSLPAAPESAVPGARARELCDRFTGTAPRFEAGGVGMGQLAEALARHAGRLVVNRTGLIGLFDLELQWTPALAKQPDRPYRLNGIEVDPAGPSIFEALDAQLGLRLVAADVDAVVVVVDAVEPPAVG